MSFSLPTPINGPIQSPSEDRLSRSGFVSRMSRQLRNMRVRDGFVYAITGTWGSGKSSILNLIKHDLLGKDYNSTTIFRENTPHVIDFNPWWFESKRDLVSVFATQLSLEISVRARTLKRLQPVAEATRLIAVSLKHIPVPVPHWDALAGAAGELATQAAHPYEKSISLELGELRSALEVLKPEEKLIVFCDDLDRLDAAEVVSMFGVMKAVAALPNLVFVTAFDRAQVERCLKNQVDDPSRYLEKIIQLEIALPATDASNYDRWFQSVGDNLRKLSSDELFDAERFRELREIAQVLIRSPRDMTRFENRLVGSFESVKGEVNIVDYLGLQLLRTIAPEIVARIQGEKVLLVDDDTARTVEEIRIGPNEVRIIEDRLKDITPSGLGNITSACEDLLGLLFPYFERTTRRSKVRSHRLNTDNQLHRICDPSSFDVYFSLEIPETRLRSESFEATWSLRNDSRMFSRALVQLGHLDHAKQFLRRMTCKLRDLQPKEAEQLLRTVLALPDDWWAPTRAPSVDHPLDRLEYERYLEESLARMGASDEAIKLLESAIPEAEGLSVLARWILRQEKNSPPSRSGLNEADRQTAEGWINALAKALGKRASSLLRSNPSKLLQFADPTHVMHFAFLCDPELASSGLFQGLSDDATGFVYLVEAAIDFDYGGERFNLDRLEALTGQDLPALIESIDRIAPRLRTGWSDGHNAMMRDLRAYLENMPRGADSGSIATEPASPEPPVETTASSDSQDES